jgi:DNA-binding NtrC family response regulator
MKPIWIVDDDQSIRFVLEKALAASSSRCAASPSRATCCGAGRRRAAGAGERHPHAGGSGLDLLAKVKERLPACRSSS